MLNFHVINLIISFNHLPTGIYGIGFSFILLKNRKVLVYVPPSDFFEVSGIIAVSRVQFLKTFYAELGIPKKVLSLHKKRSLPLRISLMNVSKSNQVFCEFGHIY